MLELGVTEGDPTVVVEPRDERAALAAGCRVVDVPAEPQVYLQPDQSVELAGAVLLQESGVLQAPHEAPLREGPVVHLEGVEGLLVALRFGGGVVLGVEDAQLYVNQGDLLSSVLCL